MELFPLNHGVQADLSTDMFPSRLVIHTDGETALKEPFTHNFGFVISGNLQVEAGGHQTTLAPNMYFSLPGPIELRGKAQCVVSQRIGHRGLAAFGGPIEAIGRLCYIDNCMSTLLVSPARMGDPCLNLLTFPPNVEQTLHIHPSLRFGVVVSGDGNAVLKDGSQRALSVGSVFAIPTGFPHCFLSGKSGLGIVAYHPDSDFGPTDKSNPMFNRTYVHF